jgi:hypothetical protein
VLPAPEHGGDQHLETLLARPGAEEHDLADGGAVRQDRRPGRRQGGRGEAEAPGAVDEDVERPGVDALAGEPEREAVDVGQGLGQPEASREPDHTVMGRRSVDDRRAPSDGSVHGQAALVHDPSGMEDTGVPGGGGGAERRGDAGAR